jgi:hypothetical protein
MQLWLESRGSIRYPDADGIDYPPSKQIQLRGHRLGRRHELAIIKSIAYARLGKSRVVELKPVF